jgi:hypothetical protein
MRFKKFYAIIPFLIVFLIASVTAYSYQIPACNSTLNSSCIPITSVSSITNAPRAIIYYQDGNLYITNDTIQNFTNITQVYYYNVTNVTQYTQQVTNITYVSYYINNSNGSSYTFQQNITLDNTYVRNLFNDLYSSTNFSRYYNRTEVDSLYSSCATQGQLTNVFNTIGTCATKAELINFDTRLANLNNINSMNWSSFNLTRMNEYMDNDGGFSTTWKIVIVIEGVIIVLLLIFVARTMMGGGDY